MLWAQQFIHLAVTDTGRIQNSLWKVPAAGEGMDVPKAFEQCKELWMCLTCSIITELLYSSQDLHEGRAYPMMQLVIIFSRLCSVSDLNYSTWDSLFNTAKIFECELWVQAETKNRKTERS